MNKSHSDGYDVTNPVATKLQDAFHAANGLLHRYGHAIDILLLARTQVDHVLRTMIDCHLEREGVVLPELHQKANP